MRRNYNQATHSVTIDGVNLVGLFSGTSIVVTTDGGEVAKTQGTDGPSINIATPQGGTVQVTLRQTSPSRSFMRDLHKRQQKEGDGVSCVVYDGAKAVYRLNECYVSAQGEVSTGDKEQPGIQYTITGMTMDEDNL